MDLNIFCPRLVHSGMPQKKLQFSQAAKKRFKVQAANIVNLIYSKSITSNVLTKTYRSTLRITQDLRLFTNISLKSTENILSDF